MQRLNKFTDKLENLTRSPSPKRKTQPEHGYRPQLQPRSHSNLNAKITPSPSINKVHLSSQNQENDPFENHKMNVNAFEVVVENSSQNIHPMDEPLVLRNGKKLYPESITSTNTTSSDIQPSNNIEELIKLLYNLSSFCFEILLSFWKMDLHFNISISESSNFKVHIPTVLLGIVSVKVLLYITRISTSPTYVVNSNSSNGLGIIPILVIIGLGLYWYNKAKLNLNESTNLSITSAISNNSIGDTHTLFSNETSITDDSLWSKKDSSTDSNYEYDITPPLTRENSFQSKLETRLYNQKHQVDKVKVVHRRELKQKNTKLELNLPIELKPKSQLTFEEISKQRRNELLNAFN